MQNERLLLKNINWPFSRLPVPAQRGLRGCGPMGLASSRSHPSPELRRSKVSPSLRAGAPRRGPAPRPGGGGGGAAAGEGAAGLVPPGPMRELPAFGVGWSRMRGCTPDWWALPLEGGWGLPAAAPQT